MTTSIVSSKAFQLSRKDSSGRVAHRLVGAGFAAAALINAVGTSRQASSFMQWLADSAWIPPYPWLLERLTGHAALVVGGTVVFEAALAGMLIARWHDRMAMALATMWVIGVIPALAWPYWLVNVPLAVLFGFLWWRSGKVVTKNR